jgi:ribosome biogenesis protein Nip4
MSPLKNFRPVNDYEKELIIDSISKISSNAKAIFDDSLYEYYSIFKSNKEQKDKLQIYLIRQNKMGIKNLDNLYDKIRSIGLYFGFIFRGIFYLSLEGAEFLHKRGFLSEIKCVYLNQRGERSILYGNNILKNMISKTSAKILKDDFLLIFNELNEILAIALSKTESKIVDKLRPKEIIALNLKDKGYYLRTPQ